MAESDHFTWLVSARARNQQVLLQFYDFGLRNAEALLCDAIGRSDFTMLVGAAFSLWRAAFSSDANRNWWAILGEANKL